MLLRCPLPNCGTCTGDYDKLGLKRHLLDHEFVEVADFVATTIEGQTIASSVGSWSSRVDQTRAEQAFENLEEAIERMRGQQLD